MLEAAHAGGGACRRRRMLEAVYAGGGACRRRCMQEAVHAGGGACRRRCMQEAAHAGGGACKPARETTRYCSKAKVSAIPMTAVVRARDGLHARVSLISAARWSATRVDRRRRAARWGATCEDRRRSALECDRSTLRPDAMRSAMEPAELVGDGDDVLVAGECEHEDWQRMKNGFAWC